MDYGLLQHLVVTFFKKATNNVCFIMFFLTETIIKFHKFVKEHDVRCKSNKKRRRKGADGKK